MSEEVKKETPDNSSKTDTDEPKDVSVKTKTEESKDGVVKSESDTETKNINVKEESGENSVETNPDEGTKGNSVKIEPAESPKKIDPNRDQKIIRQIEYYFGDHNLSKDKFLKEQTKTNDGWVPLKLLVTFKRLKDLSTDFDVIINALKKSTTQLMEISEDKEKIRRDPKKPLLDCTEKEQERSVYVKGFPLDSTLDQLLDFFRTYDAEHVYMRRLRTGKNEGSFKGSVFVLFKSVKEAEDFVKTEGLKYENKDLILEKRLEYSARKEKQYQELVKQREERKELKRKTRSESNGDKNTEESDENKFDPESFDKGCLLKLVGLGKTTSWEDIKQTFKAHSEVAYVEYSRGQTEAIVRFNDNAGAKHALEQSKTGEAEDKKLIICDNEIEANILEGEEEITFWRDLHNMKQNRNKRNHSRNSRGRGRGRGFSRGRGFDRKRRNDRNENDRRGGKEAKLEN